MRALGGICDTTSTLYVTKRNSVFPDVGMGISVIVATNQAILPVTAKITLRQFA
jgi:hypothetical protein